MEAVRCCLDKSDVIRRCLVAISAEDCFVPEGDEGLQSILL